MFIRVRIAMGVALAAILMMSTSTALAKGGFDFITIAGPNLKEAVRVTDTDLTINFFTFANFYEDRSKAPADPGEGYEITRHYAQGNGDVIFDRLHYYPETGYVFYDGIENGESEYDGAWYTADPKIRPVFESALAIQIGSAAPVEKKQPVTSASQPQPVESVAQAKPIASSFPSQSILVIAFTSGLVVLFVFAFGRHKSFAQ